MKKQQGSVLIITVVVLFAATMISLYAMRGTIIQDKMTANINNKVITTNAAEDGAAQFLKWANDQFKNQGGWPTSATDKNRWNTVASIPNANSGILTVNSGNNGYYWIDTTKSIPGCATVGNPCWDNANKIVTVQITGNLIKTSESSTKVLGESVYQIKVKGQFPDAVKLPDLPAALTLGGTVGSFTGKNSKNFKINGQNKLAIATMNSGASTVLAGIPDKRETSEHYSGGADCPSASGACVKNADLGLWKDPNQIMALVDSIKDKQGVTYINGDVTTKLENVVPSCAGIVIIRGNYSPAGNQCDFKGVLLILGGSFNGSGGGNTAIRGAIYVANIQGNSPGAYTFGGNTSANLSGGGNMTITYDSSFLGGDPNNPLMGGTQKTTILSWNDIL